MTEAEWLASDEIEAMVRLLRGKTTLRRRLLLGCGCCRTHHAAFLAGYAPLADRVAVIERYADGLAEEAEYAEVACIRVWSLTERANAGEFPPVPDVREADRVIDWFNSAWSLVASGRYPEALPTFREIFHPFPPARPRDWLAWENGLAGRLAEEAYRERLTPGATLDPVRLGVLADAVEEAGCREKVLVEHLRSPGPHVRGCWAVDSLRGQP